MNIKIYDDIPVILLKGVRLMNGVFRNFSGEEKTEYDKLGERHFSVMIDDEFVEELISLGLNIKRLDGDEKYEPVNYIRIKVSNKFSDPEIRLTDENFEEMTVEPRYLDFDNVGHLDTTHIEYADIVIRLSEWVQGKRSGKTPYMKSMLVKIQRDPLRSEYNY